MSDARQMTVKKPAQSAEHRFGTSWIVLCGLLLIAGIVAATTFMIADFREKALADSERELENTVRLVSRHMDQQFEEFSDGQVRLANRLSVAEFDTATEFKVHMSTPAIRMQPNNEISGDFDPSDVFLFDMDGNIINTSQPGPLPSAGISESDYFKAFRSNSTSATTLVQSVRSNVTGRRSNVLVRKLTNANGVFLGVLTRRIEAHRFEKFMGTVMLGEGWAITMIHRNGELFAQGPRDEEPIEKSIADDRVFKKAAATSGPVTVRLTAQADGEDRLASAPASRLSDLDRGVDDHQRGVVRLAQADEPAHCGCRPSRCDHGGRVPVDRLALVAGAPHLRTAPRA